ncbi:oligosaccharide flippase family protein, partial [Priestia megaterium]
MKTKLKIKIPSDSHPFWVMLQQFLARGLVAIKFLILARLLGPEGIGLISIALVTLAFIEAVTELGFLQAVISGKKELSESQKNAIWTTQTLRGIIISLLLFLGAKYIENIFKVDGTKEIITILAMVPITKNMVSINLYQFQRQRKFKDVAKLQIIASISDITSSILFILLFNSAMGAIYGIFLSELIRTLLSHKMFKSKPKINFNFSSIKELSSYGKWIWANSIS